MTKYKKKDFKLDLFDPLDLKFINYMLVKYIII